MSCKTCCSSDGGGGDDGCGGGGSRCDLNAENGGIDDDG